VIESRPVTEMSRQELEEERGALAKLRTAVRARQNDVEAEIDLRSALEVMSATSRRIVEVRLGGSLSAAGRAAAKEVPDA
jgi:hypothetical protein